ncbi:MAG: hypothetical protein P1U38_05020 [Aeromicrobium sp.]|uniref:hypothetical protein n=1 Tax=Aeromicrobium sp. TaxID=1871063 RepID=UPI0025BF2B0D|nr:hypothetical protein [Aeromicrobium sp.]MCK5891078.1 hypothetical protein [Aeromicrobium sp.]MDF1704115.1 hypothetical protein [Aeromicrobium sp.]
MRRRIGAWALTVLGVLVALVGLAVMVVLGPDGRVTTGPHAIDTDTAAVVTAPGAVRFVGVQVDLLVEVPIDKPVFVGVGNTVDVQDYLQDTARVEITSYAAPWTIQTRDVEGEPNLPSAPTALDWWVVSQAGLGGADISLTLPDEPVSVAVVAVGSTNLSGLEVTMAYGIRGGFGRGAGIALLGIGLAWFGVLLRRRHLWREPDHDEDAEFVEEVEVFVYVDEHGVEHEIDPAELEGFEIVDEEEILEGAEAEADDGADEAADVAVDEPVDEPAPGGGASAELPRPVYVWIDDDGVEHEVGEDELHEFEIAPDDEPEDGPR